MSQEPVDLSGKTAIVTGAARGLGRALSEALCRSGARVVLADMRADLGEKTSRELTDLGYQVIHCVVDVGNERHVTDCLRATREYFGPVDILINNAGVDYTLPIEELEVDQWDRVIATNLRGPFLFCKQAVEQMKPRRSGQIVNITSTAAKRAWPNASAYHASKWALLGFSHAMHAELRSHGIKVTAVVAGGMQTPFLLERFPDISPTVLQPPERVAETVLHILAMPPDSVVAEVSILPMGETSWP